MKNRFFTFIIFYVTISIICIGCSTDSKQSGSVEAIPLNIAEPHSFNGFFENNIIYQTSNKGSTSFYRYDINTDQTHKIGVIENYYMSRPFSVVIDNILYLYVTTYNQNGGETSLYALDLKEDKIVQVNSDPNVYVFIPIEEMNGQVISLKSYINQENNIADTILTAYNPETNSEEELLYHTLNYNNEIGLTMLNFDVYENKIYVLNEEIINGSRQNQIDIYDENMVLQGAIPINPSSEIAEKFNSVILDFKVLGDYIYVRNFSGEQVVASISQDGIDIILENENLDIANNYAENDSLDNPIFFLRESYDYYILDKEQGLSKHTLALETDSYIRCAIADENGVLFALRKDTDDRNDLTQSLYYLDNAYLLSEN